MEHSIALLEDFDLKSARILVSGADAVIDNVRRILILSDSGITVDHGKGQISVYGTGIRVESGRACSPNTRATSILWP